MKITKGTIVRTVMVFMVVVNFILNKFGISPINTNQNAIANVVETVISVLSVLFAWWYNNSFSSFAKKADNFLKQLKEGDINV